MSTAGRVFTPMSSGGLTPLVSVLRSLERALSEQLLVLCAILVARLVPEAGKMCVLVGIFCQLPVFAMFFSGNFSAQAKPDCRRFFLAKAECLISLHSFRRGVYAALHFTLSENDPGVAPGNNLTSEALKWPPHPPSGLAIGCPRPARCPTRGQGIFESGVSWHFPIEFQAVYCGSMGP